MAIRYAVRVVQLGSAALLMGAACDGFRLPARPTTTTVAETTTPPPAPKSNRAPKRTAKVDPAFDAERFGAIRRGLRRLVVAEETYYAENGVYTEDLSRMGYSPEKDTEVRFLWLARTGWAASSTHPGMPGRDCVIFVGRAHGAPTTLRDVRSGREGVPVCDASPRARPAPAAPPPAAAAEPPAAAPAPGRGGRRSGSRHRQRARRGQPVDPDAGRSAEPRPLPGRVLRPPGRVFQAYRAVRAAVSLAPGREDHHPQRERPILVGPRHFRLAAGEKLRHLARAGTAAACHREPEAHAGGAGHARVRRLASDLGSSKPRQLLAAAAPP